MGQNVTGGRGGSNSAILCDVICYIEKFSPRIYFTHPQATEDNNQSDTEALQYTVSQQQPSSYVNVCLK